MGYVRDVVASAVPSWAKQRHERWTTERFSRRVASLNRSFAATNELVVRRGPFRGLRYPPSFVEGAGDLVAKVVGTYELELHRVMEAWITGAPRTIVNVGCAEGFYAVGLARALPDSTVVAYEIDAASRWRATELAQLNAVADRVRVAEQCTPAALQEMHDAGERTVVLCDCEGCELALIDPARAPVLSRWELLVELHDFVDGSISGVLSDRFRATHEIELIATRSRERERPPELETMSRRERITLIAERRPGPMQWAWMRPRSR